VGKGKKRAEGPTAPDRDICKSGRKRNNFALRRAQMSERKETEDEVGEEDLYIGLYQGWGGVKKKIGARGTSRYQQKSNAIYGRRGEEGRAGGLRQKIKGGVKQKETAGQSSCDRNRKGKGGEPGLWSLTVP